MKKFLTDSKGFTLVELMVVVAIIGILSAIAVPNFKKYQAKSKQSEAKIQLAAVYSTEVGAQTDYDTFVTCIADLGYDVPPKGYYWVGFTASDATSLGQVNARAGAGAPCTAAATSYAVRPGTPLKAFSGVVALSSADLSAVVPTSNTFVATASGNVRTSDAALDKWTIDQNKNLANTVIGL